MPGASSAANVEPSLPVSEHLVFFIHGMGKQYEENGNINHHASTIQTNTTEILNSLFPDRRVRVKYIVIEWHSILHELVDGKINPTTMYNVPKVRVAMNHWLMDCMYYFTKPYGQCIIDTICGQCNGQYRLHMEENPDFKGQVHMIGFSLGGVAAYDILSMQWDDNEDSGSPPPPWQDIEQKGYVCRKPDVNVPLLDFKVSCLFTCGSPIAPAMVFRGLHFKHYHPQPHTRIYNIFHPFDPFGYRIEPMINDAWMSIHPVRVSRAPWKPILKIPNLGIKRSFAPFIMRAQRSWESISSKPSSSSSSSSSFSATAIATSAPEISAAANNSNPIADAIEVATAAESDMSSERGDRPGLVSAGTIVFEPTKAMLGDHVRSIPVQKVQDEEEEEEEEEDGGMISGDDEQIVVRGKDGVAYPRMDYMLHENVIDTYASEWIIAAKSHFRYWANRDIALHIVKSILEEN